VAICAIRQTGIAGRCTREFHFRRSRRRDDQDRLPGSSRLETRLTKAWCSVGWPVCQRRSYLRG